MSSFLYFAYGSNMLSTRLGARCSSARVHTCALAHGATVRFDKPAHTDGSGKAGLYEDPTGAQWGVVYEMALSEQALLDRIEGVGNGYERADGFCVTSSTGEALTTSTYIPTASNPALKPYDWYLSLCLAGALEHGLPEALVAGFRAQEFTVDTDTTRKGLHEAEAALHGAGHTNWQDLLR